MQHHRSEYFLNLLYTIFPQANRSLFLSHASMHKLTFFPCYYAFCKFSTPAVVTVGTWGPKTCSICALGAPQHC